MNKVLTLLAAGLILLSCGTRTVASEPQRIVVAYVTGWGSDVIPDVNYMTHINYAFGHVNESFDGIRVQNEERLRLIAGLKSQNRNSRFSCPSADGAPAASARWPRRPKTVPLSPRTASA